MDSRKMRSLRQIAKDRILTEMLHSAKGKDAGAWKVLILDQVTIKVISKICKMGDIFEEGISVVEDLSKRRQPMRTLEAVYFLHPSRESVQLFMEDMAAKQPLYKKAHVFFSMQLPNQLLQLIKSSPSVLSHIASLAELNLEFWIVDTQGFITEHELALRQVLAGSEGSSDYRICIESVAARLATVFSSLKELPAIRYRNASTQSSDPVGQARENAPVKLATALWNHLLQFKTLPNFPKTETCDLIIVTRAVDPVAPVIHEWTYNAMIHDLMELDGTKYSYETTSAAGRKEQKDVLLEEHDPVWKELRDLHIADASSQLSQKMTEFGEKNKAAMRMGSGAKENMTTRDMQKLVQALPQYHDALEKLSLHVNIATVLNDKIQQDGLSELGKLEQDFVFGDATSKDLINILSNRQDLSTENKIRLLMIFGACHPEKMEGNKLSQWLKLARLNEEDAEAVTNLHYLGVSLSKKQSGHHFLKFGSRLQGKHGLRKDRELEEGAWQLSKFTPAIQDMVEELAEGKLSKTDFPYLRAPSQESTASDTSAAPHAGASGRSAAQSARSKRTGTWAHKTAHSSQSSEELSVSELSLSGGSSVRSTINGSGSKVMGKRIFVFIIGGMTHSELRAAHKLTDQLKREVIIGSTALDNCHQFIEKVKSLSLDQDIMNI